MSATKPEVNSLINPKNEQTRKSILETNIQKSYLIIRKIKLFDKSFIIDLNTKNIEEDGNELEGDSK